MSFWKWRKLTRRASCLISEYPLLSPRLQSSTKYFRQIPGISHKDEVVGRREYSEAAEFASSSEESLAISSAIIVKGKREVDYTRPNDSVSHLIDALYHLTEDSVPFKIPIVKYAHHTFSAGETLRDVYHTLKRTRERGLKGILHYSVEDAANNAVCDANFDQFLRIVSPIALFSPQSISFTSLKLSAICTPELLERVSHLLRWQHRHPDMNLPWKEETLPVLAPSSPDHHTTFVPEPLSPTEENDLNLAEQILFHHTISVPEPLSPAEENDLNLAEQRLFRLCRAYEAASIPLLVDAEYAAVQPAIDYLVYRAFSKFNRSPGKPVVYGTVQAYLKDSLPRLIAASEEARKRGIRMGVKLVRGAYMKVENRVAKSCRVPSPIHSSIMETRNCFDSCASFLLEKVAAGEASLLLATHNLASAKMAIAKSEELDIVKSEGGVQFAQLKGMADLLSLSLQNAGFQVSKFLPFGPVEKMIPYLMRRAEENQLIINKEIMGVTFAFHQHFKIRRLLPSRLETTSWGSSRLETISWGPSQQDDTSEDDNTF